MSDLATARGIVANTIDAVTITFPVSTGIAAMLNYRPDGGSHNGPWPVAMITGYSSRWLRLPGSHRQRIYTIGIRLGVQHDDIETGSVPLQAILEALKEAISAAFDSAVALGSSGYHILEGPNWLSKEPLTDGGGRMWDDAEIILQLDDAQEFIG